MSDDEIFELRHDVKSILKEISGINVSLVRVTASVEHHIERTDKLEDIILEVKDKQDKCPARLEEQLKPIKEEKRKKNLAKISVLTSVGMLIVAAVTLYLQWKGTINLMP
jgi:uncharacterized coiled-coil DUF342 family protein